jgi:hypothetical protein
VETKEEIMAKKKVGKKRNVVDPIVHLAEKNKAKSIADAPDPHSYSKRNSQQHKPKLQRDWQEEFDPRIADTDADTLFREMKRRDF